MAQNNLKINYCLKCGDGLPKGANFCPSCGQILKQTSDPKIAGVLRNRSPIQYLVVLLLGIGIWGIGWGTQSSLAGKKPTDTYDGLLDSKLQTLRENAKSSPTDKEALIALASSILQKVRETGVSSPDLLHEAIDALRQILKLDPNDPFALLAMGDLSFESELYSKAIELYEKFLGQDPSNFHALASLSVAYSQVGDLQKSIERGEKALTVAPSEDAKKGFLEFFDKLRSSHAGVNTTLGSQTIQTASSAPAGVAELASFVQSNQIAGPKFVNYEMLGTNILALRFQSFPMAAMPPFPKEKFLTGIKTKASELKISAISEIHFIDSASGEVMEKLLL